MRRDGRIVTLTKPIRREIDFGDRTESCVSISWGDVATAHYSTGARDIEVLFRSMPEVERAVKLGPLMRFLLATRFAQAMLKRQIDKQPEGPDAAERARLEHPIRRGGKRRRRDDARDPAHAGGLFADR